MQEQVAVEKYFKFQSRFKIHNTELDLSEDYSFETILA